jgi:hypothetical protein
VSIAEFLSELRRRDVEVAIDALAALFRQYRGEGEPS